MILTKDTSTRCNNAFLSWVFMASPPLPNNTAAREPFWNVCSYYSARRIQHMKWIMMPFQWQHERKPVAAILGGKRPSVIRSSSSNGRGASFTPWSPLRVQHRGQLPAPRALRPALRLPGRERPSPAFSHYPSSHLYTTLPLHLPFASFSPPPLTSAAVTGQ